MSDDRPLGDLTTRLADLRADARRRWLVTVGGVVVGLAAVWLHWLGFVLGGALVALPQRSLPRGLLAGFGFGVLSWLAFALWLASTGDLSLYLGMGQVRTVSTAIALVGGLLGSLARGVI